LISKGFSKHSLKSRSIIRILLAMVFMLFAAPSLSS
jgi:hypothetical protein